MAEIFEKENTRKPNFIFTLDHMGTPLKIKISKVGLRHVLIWSKLGLEPKFHETGTFRGLGKRAQSLSDIQRIFNTI